MKNLAINSSHEIVFCSADPSIKASGSCGHILHQWGTRDEFFDEAIKMGFITEDQVDEWNNMFVYVSNDLKALQKFSEDNLIPIYNGNVHHSLYEWEAGKIVSERKPVILYNPGIMDYIDPKFVGYVQKSWKVIPFARKFAKKLEYMYNGEILMNAGGEK